MYPRRVLPWRRLPIAAAAVFLVLLCSGSGCTDPRTLAAVPWWCLQRDGLCHVYLYPTLHVGDRPPRLPEPVLAALDRSTLLVELDPDDPNVRSQYRRLAQQDAGHSLRNEIAPGLFRRLERAVAATGGSTAELSQTRIWAVADALGVGHLESHGLRPAYGVDRALMRLAAERQRPRRSLESLGEQLEVYRALPPALRERYLVNALEETESARLQWVVRRMLDAYAAGELDRMAALSEESGDPSVNAFLHRFHRIRNRAFAAAVAELQRAPQPSFVAVGALHFVGEANVLELLRARGLTPVAAH